MSKRRGNPDWGKPAPPMRAELTQFEKMAKRLKLSAPQYGGSVALKNWALRNKTHRYVPTELLKAWGIHETSDS